MVTFLLKNPHKERSSIDMLVSFRGRKYRRSTHESVPVKQWSKAKKRAKVSRDFPAGETVNVVLDKWEVAAMKAMADFKEHRLPPEPAYFFATIDRYYYKDIGTASARTFIDTLDDFVKEKRLSEGRRRSYAVLRRAVERYQLYSRTVWELDTLHADDLYKFEKFLREEHTFFITGKDGGKTCKEQYRHLYEQVPESRLPAERGNNTISAVFNKIVAVLNYALSRGLTTNADFHNYKPPTEVYGTPYYLTLDEVKQIYQCDLSGMLATQRDIFVFQCLVGCRVGDLRRLTKSNIIDGILHYVPGKTKDKSQRVVEVPLNETALEILKKYSGDDTDALLPFISSQKYNDAIKVIAAKAGITRKVIVMNPITGAEESVPIDTVASSHMARRTFIGNLYKRVKDPNLIGVMSGHSEGSKAFARYRDIDTSMKRELVEMIEL